MLDSLKKVWGVGAPRGFKAGAWIIAFAAFAAWQYHDKKQLPAMGGPLVIPDENKAKK